MHVGRRNIGKELDCDGRNWREGTRWLPGKKGEGKLVKNEINLCFTSLQGVRKREL